MRNCMLPEQVAVKPADEHLQCKHGMTAGHCGYGSALAQLYDIDTG